MKTYIIHVKKALQREIHILKQLQGRNLDAEFILEGDLSEITNSQLEMYFEGSNRTEPSGATSCAFKHFEAYRKMVENNIPIALILEDDIILESDFNALLEQIQQEIRVRKLNNFLISIEDSYARYIKRSSRVKGQCLYSMPNGRYAGAYIVDLIFAKSIVTFTTRNKCDMPVDLYHNECSKAGIINIFWSHPTMAYQDEMGSLINERSRKLKRVFSFWAQRYYKRILFFFR